ncbi:MAG: hypothetical protein AAGF92_01770 [Myxococcota bacterium]
MGVRRGVANFLGKVSIPVLAATACTSVGHWSVASAQADTPHRDSVPAEEVGSNAVADTESTETTLIVVGGANGETPSPTLDRLKERLASADPSSTIVIFTGNYSISGGMPGKSDDKRTRVERDVDAHIDAVHDFVRRGGQTYFLAGNNDYQGRKDVRRLRKHINRKLSSKLPDGEDRDVDVMPNADCGEPTILELGDFGVVVLVNSQWWMRDWKAHARFNEGCEFNTRGQLSSAVELLMRKHRTKRVIIALHHPLKSLGEYGGHFAGVEHVKPPIAGSLVVWAKQGGLVQQYRNHVKYDSLASSLEASAEQTGAFVFVSGHDRSLQVLRVGRLVPQVQIVSGSSGSDPTRVARSGDGEFAEQASGWAELRLNAAHEDTVTLIDGVSGETLFTEALPPITRVGEEGLPAPVPPTEATAVSTFTKEKPRKTRWFKRMLLGAHYRESHRLEIEFPVLDLSTEQGGLSPVRIGGGNQTNSLRLEDPNGRQWALRSTTKDSSRLLPYPLNESFFVTLLVEDAYTATHPAAALAIPPMAEAVGIFHTRPRLMYLPDQPALLDTRGYISDEVVLLERRPKRPKEGTLPAHLGGDLQSTRPVKYLSTSDMLLKMEEKPWKHRVDEETMLRARLFDLLLGDWDRHADQWRFARTTLEDGTNVYYPIPRDRDQAFSNYDGALLFFARMSAPGVRVLRPFRDDIDRLTWLTYNARFIDPILLNRIPRERWMQIAEEVQASLTDEIIAQGMAEWPEDAYELDGAELEEKLRARRDDLVDAAAEFYEKLNKNVEIVASEQRDLIDVAYADGNAITVAIRRLKEGPDSNPYFERTFYGSDTDEIRIYGLSGRDKLVIHGEPHKAITVRFVGGSGDDLVTAEPGAQAEIRARGVKVHDRKKGIEIDPKVKVDTEYSKSTYRNHYQRADAHHAPNTVAGFPGFVFNADEGFGLGGNLVVTRTKFKRRPFASSHAIRAFFATSTLGVTAGYKGVFPETAGPLDQEISIAGQTANAVRNFFGYTNVFIDPDPEGRDFYRVRQVAGAASYGLVARLSSNTVRTGIKIATFLIDTEDTPGRFVSQSPDVNPNSLGTKLYLGSTVFIGINTFDSGAYPRRGVAAGASVKVRSDVTPNDGDRIGTSGTFSGAVATHIPFDDLQRFVLSTRARISGIVGRYPFYFAPTVGDPDIRAYNLEQLAGNAVFSQTTDMRFEFVRIKKGLPGGIGIAAAVDHGLAFGGLVDNGTYNVAVGGSLFWSILDVMGLSAGYYYGFEGGAQRLIIAFGALFGTTGVEE